MKNYRWIFASLIVFSIALWGAFALRLSFVTKVHAAQNEDIAVVKDNKPELPKSMQDDKVSETESPDGVTAGEINYPPLGASSSKLADDNFVYDPSGKRDPFRPYKSIRINSDSIKSQERDLEPLEKYEIEKLEIVAILWEVKNPRAILKTPDGSAHTVSKSSKVGINFGKIVSIREGEIVVQEKIFTDGVPKYELKTISLK